jgi:hypothetical protein
MGIGKKHLFLILFLFIYTIFAFSETTEETSSALILQSGNPLLFSLLLSHGSGLYAMQENRRAKPYLISNIIFIDIPVAALIGAMIINKVNPDFFQGKTLTIAEYITNACILSISISIPAIRFFECREVIKL